SLFFGIFFRSIGGAFRKEIAKPWSNFRKASPVFALVKNASGKSALSFGSVFFGRAKKMNN
ncbi:MAG: hypothetical protein AAF934_06815, partial [Bacteroidota bacterium]